MKFEEKSRIPYY